MTASATAAADWFVDAYGRGSGTRFTMAAAMA
jgi:hypothetical protein